MGSRYQSLEWEDREESAGNSDLVSFSREAELISSNQGLGSVWTLMAA